MEYIKSQRGGYRGKRPDLAERNKTESQKEACRRANRSRVWIEEARKKISEANKRRINTLESNIKRSNALKGRIISKESIEKRREFYRHHPRIGLKLDANPNWRGGIACEPYCDVWADTEFKKGIKRRDGNICKLCGVTNMLSLIVYGRELSLHHIDYNKKNCHPKNLLTTCVACNSKLNFEREYWTNELGCING